MIRSKIINDDKTAVVAITVYQDSVLMLKRVNPPINWCPPCGRVHEGETLELALRREVMEEAGLEINILKYVFNWEGIHTGEKIRSYTFVCLASTDKVVLSEEHIDYVWVPIVDLQDWSNKTDFNLESWPDWIFDALGKRT